ncbi:DNA topoisomerase [Pseudomonas aeruginosa]|uniref:DNA topoisomerase n=1 Tax=Pseudomonas aeruginosa TaxID=287 RepID=UPI00093B9984|nr:DNA topoisomerase [Pseudomonas aeruginosa]
MPNTVFVIEAPGKIRSLRKILSELRINAQVVATGGALYDMPKDQLGLNPNDLTPERWTPTSQRTISHLTKKFKDADQIYVMTDADREGELIAAQVNSVLVSSGSKASIQRVVTSALNADGISQALQRPRAINRQTCVAVMARRGIDRAIGFLCSNRNVAGQIAGRISSKIVQSVSRQPLPTCKVAGTHPDQPGWRIWGKGSSGKEASLAAINEAFRRLDPALMDHTREVFTTKPAPAMMTGADALILVANQLNVSLSEAEKLIQTAYERGAISYPRTDSRDISPPTQVMLESAMRKLGKRVRVSRLPPSAPREAAGAHEAIYPCAPLHFNANSLEGLSQLDAAIGLLTRRAFASLSPDAKVKSIEVEQSAISSFLAKQGLPDIKVKIWRDIPDTAGWLVVEKEFIKPVKLVRIPLDTAVMERMVEQGIGRPSTIVGHIDKALARGWIQENGTLSNKGQAVLTYLQQNYPGLLGPEDLDHFFDGVPFERVSAAVYEGIHRLNLDYQALRVLAREASADLSRDQAQDESGLPLYEPTADMEMDVAGP